MKEEKAIYEYLKRYHRGREKAVCSNELERLFCLTGRSLRRRIASLRQSGFPICSCASGYYYPTTLQDVNATMSWLNELVYIDTLQNGDDVIIHNLWDTLHYKVTEIKIISPSAVGELLIQQDKDMVTLLSCHPYASGGRMRYAVFCERTNN